jgi:demethylmenaquinone methyltransferase/2-methoxy-6-polyprenyl-1,4-benzoquinol methylase
MSHLTGQERAQYVQAMFTRIAGRYDLMNRLMTAGQDVIARHAVLDRAGLPRGGRLLDLGAGTGDLALATLQRDPTARVIAADFTLEMMRVGKERPLAAQVGGRLEWCAADATRLPFHDDSFDAVVSGYLLRNVIDLPRSLSEQRRVLKPGGWMVALDTTPPPENWLAPFIRFHLHTIIPTLGGLLTGEGDAYRYLPESTEHFLPPERMAARLLGAGFSSVGYQRRLFGVMAVYWGQKAF